MARSLTPILDLPREIRDLIYQYCVSESDGYHFNYELGKFQTAAKQPIDLALTRTCKSIREEMHGVALGSNVLHFSTVYSEKERLTAGRFTLVRQQLRCFRNNMFERIPPSCITDEVFASIAKTHPRFLPLLELIRASGASLDDEDQDVVPSSDDDWNMTEAPSIYEDFLVRMTDLVWNEPNFLVACKTYNRRMSWSPLEMRGTTAPQLPRWWCIPHAGDLVEAETVVRNVYKEDWDGYEYDRERSWKREAHRWSAAAVCIRFLGSVSETTRLQIRAVLLDEDHRSVASPACHARGLIPYCRENPRMRVERKVSLWKTLLMRSIPAHFVIRRQAESPEGIKCPCYAFNHEFGVWVKEALALHSAGLPPESSFRLLIDGEPTPARSSEVFELLKPVAAKLDAMGQWYDQHGDDHRPLVERRMDPALEDEFEGWLPFLREVIEGTSPIVRCNFDTGGLWDPQPLLDEVGNSDWHRYWFDKAMADSDKRVAGLLPYPKSLYTVPPLPPWGEMLLEPILPAEAAAEDSQTEPTPTASESDR